jgi:hypothetical protein
MLPVSERLENDNKEVCIDSFRLSNILILKAIDRDSDGTLTEEEFIEAYNKRYKMFMKLYSAYLFYCIVIV